MADKILKIGATLLSPVASILGLGSKKAAPVAAPAAPPMAMPLADDAAVARAKRASISRQLQSGGRSSTILSTGSGNTLGGG